MHEEIKYDESIESFSDELVRKGGNWKESPRRTRRIRFAEEDSDFCERFVGWEASDAELTAILRSIQIGVVANERDEVCLTTRR